MVKRKKEEEERRSRTRAKEISELETMIRRFMHPTSDIEEKSIRSGVSQGDFKFIDGRCISHTLFPSWPTRLFMLLPHILVWGLEIPVVSFAFIKFKDIVYNSYKMSSWAGNECCMWEGIQSDGVTGNVQSLHFKGHDDYNNYLAGHKVSSSLAELRHLKYLD